MTISVGPDLETVLKDVARKQGVAPEALALQTLRERFLSPSLAPPHDEWERRLRGAATDCGISLSNDAVSSEGLYE